MVGGENNRHVRTRARAPTLQPTVGAVLRVAAAAGLAVDAYVHAHLAGRYDAVAATVSQGDLFRVEAALAGLGVLTTEVGDRAHGVVILK